MPTQAYRSSGRPEVTFAIERLIDNAAAELGFDRIELRRKNLVKPKAMPYRNAVGMLYDSGRYEDEHGPGDGASPTGTASRRAAREAKKRGKLLRPRPRQLRRVLDRRAATSSADITVQPRGPRRCRDRHAAERPGPRDELRAGGRRSAGVPVEAVEIILGDTDVVKAGGGSHSGRSMRHAATVFSMAAAD